MCGGVGTSILGLFQTGNACFRITFSSCCLSASLWCWCSRIGRVPWPFLSRGSLGSSHRQRQPSTVTLGSDNKCNLCPCSGFCWGTSVLGVEEGKKQKRDWWWWFRRAPKITSTALNVQNFKLWHGCTFSNWSFERMHSTRSKQQFFFHQKDSLWCLKSI